MVETISTRLHRITCGKLLKGLAAVGNCEVELRLQDAGGMSSAKVQQVLQMLAGEGCWHEVLHEVEPEQIGTPSC
jgi:hypothetical protein